jgi:hypothetical protein
MGLTQEMLKKIKEEITKDPEGLDYTGKTDVEIASLLSNGYFKDRIVVDAYPSPLNRILINLAEGPNIITAIEVAQAKIIT